MPKAFEDLIDAKRIVREIKLLSKYSVSHKLNQVFVFAEFFDHENIIGLVDV